MRVWKAAAAAGLCVLTIAAYANAFTGAFVLDSTVLVLEDPRVHAVTWQTLSDIFSHTYWWPYVESNLYRPLTTLSYQFNYAALGNTTHPLGYHIVNVALHVLNVLLVFAIAYRLFDSVRLQPDLRDPGSVRLPSSHEASADPTGVIWSALAAGLWAVHPLSTEAVTYVMGRADLLAAAGVLGAFLAYLRATEDPSRVRWSWMVVALLAETAGLFSKESAVTFIAIVMLYEWLLGPRGAVVPVSASTLRASSDKKAGPHRRNRPTPEAARNRSALVAAAGRLALLVVPIVVFLLQRATVITASLPPEPFVDNPIAHASFIRGRLTALAIAGRYLWLAAWPATLSSDYSYSQIPLANGSLLDWLGCITVLALVALAGLALRRVRRNADTAPATIAFALGLAAVTFLPASNLLFPTGTIMAERLMYLPLAGLTIAFVTGARALATRAPSRWFAPAILTLLLVPLAGRTWIRNRDWQSNVSLWASAVVSAPGSFKTHKGLANALYEADPIHVDVKRVTAEADQSLAILDGLPDRDNVPEMYRRAAGYFIDLGDAMKKDPLTSFQAEPAYTRAIALADRHVTILKAVQATQPPSAGAEQAIADAYALQSMAYGRSGDAARSLEASRRAMAAQPLNAEGYRTLAVAFALSGQLNEEAVALLTGFMVTGDAILREALFDLYKGGLDAQHCAAKPGPNGQVLNPDCPVVRQHLCAATTEAIRIQNENGRADLVSQLKAVAAQSYGCSGLGDAAPAR